MNGGRIEQAGSPEDIYDRPRSEFVARFIGSSNVLNGKALDDEHASSFAGHVLRCDGRATERRRARAGSIRPHDIDVDGDSPRRCRTNRCRPRGRQVFLGGSRD